MLKSLQITNFALIGSLEIDFAQGLHIITGETGAGKSIIVDALMMLLGERGNTDMIREGEERSVIEGIFEFNKSHPVFRKMQNDGYESFGDEIIIRREIRRKGASRCFLNDSPIPVSELKNFGDILVDFHGQHDHQSLLKPKNHLNILDSAGDYTDLLPDFKSVRNELLSLIHDQNELIDKKQTMLEKEEFQRQQLKEINKVNPQPEEDSQLESELKIKENYEQLFNSTSQLFDILYDGNDSVHDKLTAAGELLNELAEIDDNFSDYINELNAAVITVDEIAK